MGGYVKEACLKKIVGIVANGCYATLFELNSQAQYMIGPNSAILSRPVVILHQSGPDYKTTISYQTRNFHTI